MKVEAIIPTAGLGVRFGEGRPKSLVSLKKNPLFIWTLEAVEESELVDNVILVVPEACKQEFEKEVAQYSLEKVSKVVIGGATRYESVKNGLKELDNDTNIVVVHDGARPLIEVDIINKSIQTCQAKDAVIVAVPVKPTIKKVSKNLEVIETFNRDELWEVQTPQVFNRDLLVRAYESQTTKVPTDDSFLVENIGERVKVIMGSYRNLKITTPEDLKAAEAFLS